MFTSRGFSTPPRCISPSILTTIPDDDLAKKSKASWSHRDEAVALTKDAIPLVEPRPSPLRPPFPCHLAPAGRVPKDMLKLRDPFLDLPGYMHLSSRVLELDRLPATAMWGELVGCGHGDGADQPGGRRIGQRDCRGVWMRSGLGRTGL